ncbi:MAG TPA: 1-acyl-sn-glycerol-3-phosphate acyltransferase [Cryomorphaceae bacterium]|nr:1-acyl-sn-glycerol-3-phosphate acyltransferase [Cryomorphaceae bacterium]
MPANGKFEDIRPYRDAEVPEVISRILRDKGFTNLLRYVYPDTPLEPIKERVASVKTIADFQAKVAHPAMRKLVNETTDSITVSGLENILTDGSHLFISNHRDIILDSAILNIMLFEAGLGTFETAIGSNLLEEELVRDLTKMNKNFTVKRNATAREFYENSVNLSQYIHHTICERNTNVWIAQREGRTKDGMDKTQPGLLKMLSINCEKPLSQCFRELNITPVAISYEYDPCDVLKIPELKALAQEKKYEKQKGEDYNSILTGLTGYKGRIHLSIGKPLNEELNQLIDFSSPNDKLKELGEIIDQKVYGQYKLWPTNHIAFDLLEGVTDSSNYTKEEKAAFMSRMERQLALLDLNSEEDRYFLLNMYANPVKNFNTVSTEGLDRTSTSS